jgi:hypothetical protein
MKEKTLLKVKIDPNLARLLQEKCMQYEKTPSAYVEEWIMQTFSIAKERKSEKK